MVASRTGNVDAMKVLLDHGADVNAKETLRGTTPLMWAADEGHAAAIQLLIQHGADIKARSNPAERGRGPALGKSNDPRKAVAAQGAALAAGQRAGLGRARRLCDGDRMVRRRPSAARRGAPALRQQARRRCGRGAVRRSADDAAVAAGFGGGPTGPERWRRSDAAGLCGPRPTISIPSKSCWPRERTSTRSTAYGWSPLLVATQNRYYKLGAYLLDHGADVNLANKGGWTPLYLATDNRNIESGDYPVRKGDMDHLDFIKLLLDKGANVNARMKDSTETRTVFTNQWLDENGATAFLRASQSGDIVLMKLLLAHGADPKIETDVACDGAAGGRRNRLGGRDHLRVVARAARWKP